MKKQNDQSLKNVLKQMVEAYRLKDRLLQKKVEDAWARTMGPTIGNYTQDLKLRNHKLYITILSASLKQELSFSKEKIKKLINEELEGEYVRDVVIR